MGGVRIRIPKDWIVNVERQVTAGGIYAERELPEKGKVTLHLHGRAILGGIAIF